MKEEKSDVVKETEGKKERTRLNCNRANIYRRDARASSFAQLKLKNTEYCTIFKQPKRLFLSKIFLILLRL